MLNYESENINKKNNPDLLEIQFGAEDDLSNYLSKGSDAEDKSI